MRILKQKDTKTRVPVCKKSRKIAVHILKFITFDFSRMPVGNRIFGVKIKIVLSVIFISFLEIGFLKVTWAKDFHWGIHARPWPQAESIFHTDPYWLGGDGASSIYLGDERILWLFGDTFIGTGPSRNRRNACIIRNSIGMQQGKNPTESDIAFAWEKSDEKPSAFFPGRENQWLWPGSGIRLYNTLFIFFMVIEKSPNALGFDVAGWKAAMVINPDKSPQDWHMQWLRNPDIHHRLIVGTGSVVSEGNYVYTCAVDSLTHRVYLLRWPSKSFLKGNLSNSQWWSKQEWIDYTATDPLPSFIFQTGAMEFSIHYNSSIRKYIQIESGPLDDPKLFFRTAPAITGAWSAGRPFFLPEESKDDTLLIYAGKAHPSLSGANPAISYVVNAKDFNRLLSDQDIYYPRMLKGSIEKIFLSSVPLQ